MRIHSPPGPSTLLRLVLSAIVATLWTGCSTLPTAPKSPIGSGAAAQTAPAFLTTPQSHVAPAAASSASSQPILLASEWVDAGVAKTVVGGRYQLDFAPGSLSSGAQITISAQDPKVLKWELGPHGTVFGDPVTLTVDYAGTNADPTSSNYDGSIPVLLWLNPAFGSWEVVAGRNLPQQHMYVVKLAHFSSYAMASRSSGTGEW